MKRDMIHIDEEKCNGCGECIPNCHEGALQLIDGKARLISDLMCDGLGACIGHCPEGAITIEKREAEPYDEVTVMKEMLDFDPMDVLKAVHNSQPEEHHHVTEPVPQIQEMAAESHGGGCPGSKAVAFENKGEPVMEKKQGEVPSQLTHWPVQMHLIHPSASYFKGTDFLLAADCTAFSLGIFHSNYLKGRTLGIACPKLDTHMEVYLEKLQSLIDQSEINTLTVMVMEVPCCGGLLQIAKSAADRASRKVPVKAVMVGTQGEILKEEWM